MRWTPLGLAAVAALVVATGGCGSQITVPDQGIIVTGCQRPAQCYRNDCDCTRAAVEGGQCSVDTVCSDQTDRSTCICPTAVAVGDGGAHYDSVCIETAQACVGRGVVCGGASARCMKPGSTCDGTGDLPMLIPTFGMPMLESHCQYVNDICCNGPSDGGVAMTD